MMLKNDDQLIGSFWVVKNYLKALSFFTCQSPERKRLKLATRESISSYYPMVRAATLLCNLFVCDVMIGHYYPVIDLLHESHSSQTATTTTTQLFALNVQHRLKSTATTMTHVISLAGNTSSLRQTLEIFRFKTQHQRVSLYQLQTQY